MAYVDANDVAGRCAGVMRAINNDSGVFTSSTDPSLAQVKSFIADVESALDGHLQAIGLAVPFAAGSVGESRARNYVLTGVVGLVYSAYSRAGGDTGDVDGEDMIEQFRQHLKDIQTNQVYWKSYYSAAASTAQSSFTTEGTARDPFFSISKKPNMF